MKIFIDKNNFKKENLNKILNEFKNHEIITDVNGGYDSEAIIVEPSYCTKENLDKYKNLKWIQSLRAGFDNVDLDYIKNRNIVFTNAKDVYSISIAEDVITKILVLNRNVKTYIKNMENEEWLPNFNEPEIYNSTVGIIGMGSIAKEIAKRIKAFNTNVIGYRRTHKEEEYFDKILVGEDGLNQLLKGSDYVILTVPLNEGTKGMINKEKLDLMKPTALLINIARGGVVVQEDLITALKEKTIRGAGLDVVAPEPLPKGNELWSLDSVYLTPHCSAASPHINTRLTDLILDNLKRYTENRELLHIV